ncbi:COX assembly mitochondrial protein 2-like protein [Iris pallida]|uniref:COX assembly mitochondrial protein 2-like protein n=1 Tax=Iris pallida TaxID=29817 RepID=A0AAX6HXX7_IRIPA|nr:COX assembly mitochondrial protein 2-like protein [Iris pallida]KAJ6845584.1 COX assembly mitochondrial protein 2-like protein [Iris pallida]
MLPHLSSLFPKHLKPKPAEAPKPHNSLYLSLSLSLSSLSLSVSAQRRRRRRRRGGGGGRGGAYFSLTLFPTTKKKDVSTAAPSPNSVSWCVIVQ